MRALVVYESMFGNTQRIAAAVADGLAPHLDVRLVEVGQAAPRPDADVDLVVVGGPTHAFGMTRASTRQDAARQAPDGAVVSAGIGVREWLDGLRPAGEAVAAAAFDTRVNKPRMPGSAARAAQRRLRRHGFRIAAPAATFYVTGTQGPLIDHEVDRARTWGARLGVAVTEQASRRAG